MKYPATQFEVLLCVMKQLSVHMKLNNMSLSVIHYIVYQQLSDSQKHNHLYCIEGGILKRGFDLTENEKLTAIKFIENTFDFRLYPEKCNDTNVETAVRKALKQLNIK